MAETRDRRPGLRILAFVHGYPPLYNAGAEYMLESMFRWLTERGHQCRVMLAPGQGSYTRHGVEVVSGPAELEGAAFYHWAERHARWSNLILTHLDFTTEAVGIGRVNQRPVVHLVHNQSQLGYFHVTRSPLVIFNSEWVAAEVAWTGGPSLVVRPPVFARDYRVEPNGAKAITLVATIKIKGVERFYEIARRMPSRSFIGVEGNYNHNEPPPDDVTNVTIVPNGPNISEVYEQTRILLVPSEYESWSRCAIEAGISGIPVIAAPTPGLRESLGEAGIFAEQTDTGAWVRNIENLDDPRAYKAASEAVRARAEHHEKRSRLELLELENALYGVA